MLPPTCTRLIPSASWTSRAKSLFTLPKTKKSKGSKGGKGTGGAKAAGAKQEDDNAAAASAGDSGEAGDGKGEDTDGQVSQQVRHSC